MPLAVHSTGTSVGRADLTREPEVVVQQHGGSTATSVHAAPEACVPATAAVTATLVINSTATKQHSALNSTVTLAGKEKPAALLPVWPELHQAAPALTAKGTLNLHKSWLGQWQSHTASNASGSHLDSGRAPYVLYGVKYIDLVSLW